MATERPGLGLKWRVVWDEPRSGARNMALDHALAISPRPGEGVVRLYSWINPTVSFGRNEPSAGLYDTEAAKRRGIDFVRRPTGGRAVLHDAELTYAVVAPARAVGGFKAAYLKINNGIARGLADLGADVTVAESGVTLAPDAGPCFQVPAPGEVVTPEGKVVGSAQVRIGSVLLQHGSIILDGDQSVLNELAGGTEDVVQPGTLRSQIGAVGTHAVAEAIVEGLRLALGGSWDEGDYRSGELAEADWLEKERYGKDEWTWEK